MINTVKTGDNKLKIENKQVGDDSLKQTGGTYAEILSVFLGLDEIKGFTVGEMIKRQEIIKQLKAQKEKKFIEFEKSDFNIMYVSINNIRFKSIIQDIIDLSIELEKVIKE